jgi:hypothetical protein
MRSFVTCTLHQIIIRAINSRKMRLAVHEARMGKGKGEVFLVF